MSIKACIIGHPLSHTVSPLIHGYWIRHYGLKGSYEAKDILPAQLHERFPALIAQGYTGFNVTIPFKEIMYDVCDTLDDTARRIGAVNTLRINEKQEIHGLNTDAYGFTESIRKAFPSFDFKAAPALVLGAGGAARAVVYALMEAGVPDIFLANRTPARAVALGRDFGVRALSWEDRHKRADEAGLLVNTTALGMTGQPPLLFDVQFLPAAALVCDIVYNPLQTPLLRAAAARGLGYVGGLGMLLYQAQMAFSQWFGFMPAVTKELEKFIEAALVSKKEK